MLWFYQFLLPLLKWAFCVHFIHRYWFWGSLIIFRLEAINPRNIWACLKDSLNVNMKLFPGCLTSWPRISDSQLPFKFCFTKNSMPKLSPGYATVSVLIWQSTCFICTKPKQKQNQVMSHSNWPCVLLFNLAHKQCNGIIKGWLHCLSSESKGRLLVSNILMFGTAWCLVIG